MRRIETVLPIGWAHGDRYSVAQWDGAERYYNREIIKMQDKSIVCPQAAFCKFNIE